MKRNVYLKTKDLENAIDIYLSNINPYIDKEIINVKDSLNRVTTKAIKALVSTPFYNASAMDGIAVISNITKEVNEKNPIILDINKDFIYVNTGDVIKPPYDSVIMIEDVIKISESKIQINNSAAPFENIRPVGEDIIQNDIILEKYHKIRAIDIAALVSTGVTDIEVYKQITVGIIPTGSEIVNSKEELEIGKIIDSNSYLLSNLLKENNINYKIYPITKDKENDLLDIVSISNKENDITFIIAGSSAGSKDYNKSIIEALGTVYIHGVAIKPGKPVILGKIEEKIIIGIPGFPVSAYLVFQLIVKKVLNHLYHQYDENKVYIDALVKTKIYSNLKEKEYIRVKLSFINDQFIATPLNRGAGNLKSVVDADGIITINKNEEGILENSIVQVELLKSIEKIKNRLITLGSHDLSLDIINDFLIDNNLHLSSNHLGSMGGLYALSKGECIIAPTHLLDTNSNTYNTEYVKKYFKNEKMVLIKCIKRAQVLLTKKANPKNIINLDDLQKEGILYVNRQKGAGTRVLFDYLLNKHNIDKSLINGYTTELKTHTAVGMAISSDSADAGIAIQAIANIFNLDSKILQYEDYDFLTYEKYLNLPEVKQFIKVLNNPKFKEELESLGGYTVNKVEFEYVG